LILPTHSGVKVGEFKIGLIAREKKPLLSNCVQSDPHISDSAWAVREGMVSFAGYRWKSGLQPQRRLSG
jgi:hypothetical protein